MEIAYDATADALYVHITHERVACTEEADSGTLVDLGTGGTVIGVEVIRPSRPWLSGFMDAYGERLSGDDRRMMKAFLSDTYEPHKATDGEEYEAGTLSYPAQDQRTEARLLFA